MEDELDKYIAGIDPYDLNDIMTTGIEIFYVDKAGNTRQVSVIGEEGQQVLNKFYDR